MGSTISQRDREVLRELAKVQLECAKTPKMERLTKEWYLHNDLKGNRPMFTVEMWTFAADIPLGENRCESDFARAVENEFLRTLANHKYIDDDKVVPVVFPVSAGVWLKPFDMEVKKQELDGSLGHQFVHQINDLEKDFHLLKKSTYGAWGMKNVLEYKATLEDVFGDILPVEIIGNGLYSVPTQDIVHIMGMENMLYSMYDYPELFHQMMDNLTNDYLEYFHWLESEKLLVPTTSYGWVGNGTYAFSNELPNEESPTVKQVWGFMDSQETVGLSPEMFSEFIFPYYKKVSDQFGLLSYGCCEPVHSIYDNCLSKCGNLRKLSISPWCDEEFMGERLRNTHTIYHRKPSPNYLGVGQNLDEEGWREHITKTLKAANGCKLEITQRDVYSLGGNLNKLKRFTQIVREAIEDHWE